MRPAEELTEAADKLDRLMVGVSPGPWFYNGYSWIGSGPKMLAYDAWEPEADHTLERTGKCEPCGEWRDSAACHSWPRGHGCRYFDQDYDMDSEVCGVRSHHGDTAIRSRAVDAEYIAALNPLVGKALAEWLRSLSATLAGDPSDYCAGVGHGEYDGAEECDSWFCPTITHALALARLINGGES